MAWLSAGVAGAHNGGASYVVLAPSNDGWRAAIDLPLPELAAELALDANNDNELSWNEVLSAMPRVHQALTQRLTVTDASGQCSGGKRLLPNADAQLAYRDTGVHLRIEARISCARAGAGPVAAADLHIDASRWIQDLPDHGIYITRSDRRASLTLLAGSRLATTEQIGQPSSPSGKFVAFLWLGVEHMLTGYDHLAFLGLLLLGLIAPWRDTGPGWRLLLRDAIRLISAFTAAHSLTLALAAGGWVRLPAAAIEAAIAASIVVAALAVLRGWRALLGWHAAFAFGLIHGLGFANMLAQLLQGADLALPLLAFNLGLEAAQLAAVLLLMPLLVLALRWPVWPARAAPVAAGALGLLGIGWLWERL